MAGRLVLDVLVSPQERVDALRRDVRTGLAAVPKSLPPVWFYDEAGSRLYDQITRLPEYYPSRTEAAILRRRAADMVSAAGADTLVEIGSGTSEKTRLLLDAMAAAGTLRGIILFDISAEVLEQAAAGLGHDYGVDVHAVVGDFREHLAHIPPRGRRLWAFLGGTVGNLVGADRSRLLADLHRNMRADDYLLLGTDLVKSADRLVAAYDDAAGVTAAFNRNVLAVLNRELGATFDPSSFDHVAVWNAEREWVEMRLRSRLDQAVEIPALGLDVSFARGEDLLTEVSAKFRPDRLGEELAAAGLVVHAAYRDEREDFQVTLVRVGP